MFKTPIQMMNWFQGLLRRSKKVRDMSSGKINYLCITLILAPQDCLSCFTLHLTNGTKFQNGNVQATAVSAL